MNERSVLNVLRNVLDETSTLQVRKIPIDETVVTVSPDGIHTAVQALIEQCNTCHLSTITGQDTGEAIQLLYHFWDGHGLTLCTSLPRENARIDTLTDLIPGAAFYLLYPPLSHSSRRTRRRRHRRPGGLADPGI